MTHIPTPPTLLSLPPELRLEIYTHLLPATLTHYADSPSHPPSLLLTSHQLRHEFTPLFYGSDALKLDAYYSSTDSWCSLTDSRAKRVVLESQGVVFKDLADFWSLASARRLCEHTGGERGCGILTVFVAGVGARRWMWRLGF